MKKDVIFGAGNYGMQALEKLGAGRVAYFLDNDEGRHGTSVRGIPVISVEEFAPMQEGYHVWIASSYARDMAGQLEKAGVADYSVFRKESRRYYDTGQLVYNPYVDSGAADSGKDPDKCHSLEPARRAVYEEAGRLYGQDMLFSHVEVETVNRCNGTCSFCPVNRKADPRVEKRMDRALFENIVEQLAGMGYAGRFTTFSNNEPLLDGRIIDFNRYARERLPKAWMHLFTNGTLLTVDKFKALVEILDELVIDNYQQELRLIGPCREIQDYCISHPELARKVTIVLRKPHEVLTSRGGTAPNRTQVGDYGKDRCVLPFRQMIIRPDGKVSLCCNDALGKYTLGDLTKEGILDVWHGPKFRMVRKCLHEGRENWGNCRHCDAFSMG